MNDDQIKHMVARFLAWRLPENFSPDGGITFKKTFNEHTAHPMEHQPTGTNLFGYDQAEAMVRHLVEGLPSTRSKLEQVDDRYYEEARNLVVRDRKASTSYLQRRLQLSYDTALRLMERLEREGIVGPRNHAGAREVLA